MSMQLNTKDMKDRDVQTMDVYDVSDEGDTEVEVVSHGEGINTDRGDTFLTECSSQHWEHTGGALLPYQGGAGGGGAPNFLFQGFFQTLV